MIDRSIKENRKVEFKTSLFFTANEEKLDEAQIGIIIRTLASFMNSEGGELYLGVNDKGDPSADIEEEYSLMNDYPAYKNSVYSLNEDGYKRFVQDWVAKWLGNYAVSLLEFKFYNEGGIQFCKISASKSFMPIWFNREELYVRCDASTRRLKGDDITRFYMGAKKLKVVESNMLELVCKAKENIVPNEKILVVYPNGEYIYERSGKATMLEVIRRAGIKNVIGLDLVGRRGNRNTPYVPFISKEEYRDNSGATQTREGDYFILIKYSIGDLIEKLTQISLGLGLGLHIEKY